MVETTTQDSNWFPNRTALAHAPEFDVGCLVGLRIGYDQSLNQGSLSIKIVLIFAGFHNESHAIMLSIPP